jgi:hypothetical protein
MDQSCIVAANAGYLRDEYMQTSEEFFLPDNFDEMTEYDQQKCW